jgi:hypothetical protein
MSRMTDREAAWIIAHKGNTVDRLRLVDHPDLIPTHILDRILADIAQDQIEAVMRHPEDYDEQFEGHRR